MLDQMDWQAMYPTNPEARKQEVLECSFMGRLGSYLRMEEEWMFTSFRGHLLKTTFAVRKTTDNLSWAEPPLVMQNDAVKAKMFESFDRCVRSHERSEHYDLSSQLVGSVPSTVPSTPVTGASSGQVRVFRLVLLCRFLIVRLQPSHRRCSSRSCCRTSSRS